MQKQRFWLISLFIIMFASTQVFAGYSVLDRYKLIEDKNKTEELLRPLGHDFLLDIGFTGSMDVMDVIDDVQAANKATTDVEKTTNLTNVLTNLLNTEYPFLLNINVGVPIFSFTAFGVKFVPNLRVHAGGGTNFAILAGNPITSVGDIISIFPDVPQDVRDLISQMPTLPDAGEDWGTWVTTDAPAGTPQTVIDKAAAQVSGVTSPSLSDPEVQLYVKADVKGGLYTEYFKNKWFGHFAFSHFTRIDLLRRATVSSIIKNDKLAKLGNKNTTSFLTFDYGLGHRFGRYKVLGSVEDIKVAELSDSVAEAGELNYGMDPLWRLQGDAEFSFLGFTVDPFVGVHARSGYGLSEGLYAGAKVGFHVWGDRIGVQARGMFDTQYFSPALQFKLWLAHLEVGAKLPISSTHDGVKTPSLLFANLRFFI